MFPGGAHSLRGEGEMGEELCEEGPGGGSSDQDVKWINKYINGEEKKKG